MLRGIKDVRDGLYKFKFIYLKAIAEEVEHALLYMDLKSKKWQHQKVRHFADEFTKEVELKFLNSDDSGSWDDD